LRTSRVKCRHVRRPPDFVHQPGGRSKDGKKRLFLDRKKHGYRGKEMDSYPIPAAKKMW